ncbi:MAG: hypothetical protein SOZ17_04760 [Agathobacter sp.]|nr:hypothetical protein [Agathobacter sp.]
MDTLYFWFRRMTMTKPEKDKATMTFPKPSEKLGACKEKDIPQDVLSYHYWFTVFSAIYGCA